MNQAVAASALFEYECSSGPKRRRRCREGIHKQQPGPGTTLFFKVNYTFPVNSLCPVVVQNDSFQAMTNIIVPIT